MMRGSERQGLPVPCCAVDGRTLALRWEDLPRRAHCTPAIQECSLRRNELPPIWASRNSPAHLAGAGARQRSKPTNDTRHTQTGLNLGRPASPSGLGNK